MRLFWIFALILLGAFLFNASSPLQGIHTIRQSDTVFAAYSYCMEGTDFLKPKVAHRGTTSGVAIGEFPLYSYIVSLPCQVRGSWSEYDPKFFILFFWILNFLIWTAWAKLYLKLAPSNKDDIASLAIIFGFSTFALLYLTISLPDNLAFLLIGLAAYLQISDFRLLNRTLSQKSISILSALLFILGFAVRPYLIPLILLVHRRWWWLTLTTVGCGIVYLL